MAEARRESAPINTINTKYRGKALAGLLLLIASVALAFVLFGPYYAQAKTEKLPGTPTTGTAVATGTLTVSATPTESCTLSWHYVPSPNISTIENGLSAVAVISTNDVWAVGTNYPEGSSFKGVVEHWDGTQWNLVPSPGSNYDRSSLYAVTAFSENDVWAAGGKSNNGQPGLPLIGHWDGTQWSESPSPVIVNTLLLGISGTGPDDIWTVGETSISGGGFLTLVEHWDGTQWSVIPSPNTSNFTNQLWAADAISPVDVWAVGMMYSPTGGQSLIEHWDGTQWSIVTNPGVGDDGILTGVTALASDDVWAVGYYTLQQNRVHRALFEHWDGTSWSVVPDSSPGTDNRDLYAVTAISADNIWAVGSAYPGFPHAGLVEHWDGTEWLVDSYNRFGTENTRLNGVAFAAPNDMWAVGTFTDVSGAQIPQGLTTHFYNPCSVATPSATATAMATSTATSTATATSTVVPPTATAIVTSTATVTRTVTSVPPTATPGNPTSTPTADPPCGNIWSVVTSPNPGTMADYLSGMTVVSPSSIWAVGQYSNGSSYYNLVEHWNGTSWSVISTPNLGTSDALNGVVALTDTDVWAGGEYYGSNRYHPIIMHWDGSSWTIVATPDSGPTNYYMEDMTAVSTNDVWAVGWSQTGTNRDSTMMLHWDGSIWSTVQSPNSGTYDNLILGVTALSANNIWAVGRYLTAASFQSQPLIEHWDGMQWNIVTGPTSGVSSYLDGASAISSNDIWAVGSSDNYTFIEHWNGSTWSIVPSASFYGQFFDVSMVSSSDGWAVGVGGGFGQPVIEHWNGSVWSLADNPYFPPHQAELRDVAVSSGGDIWSVGGGTYGTVVERYAYQCFTATPSATISATPTASFTRTPVPPTFTQSATSTVVQDTATAATTNTATATPFTTAMPTNTSVLPSSTATRTSTSTSTSTTSPTTSTGTNTAVVATSTATASRTNTSVAATPSRTNTPLPATATSSSVATNTIGVAIATSTATGQAASPTARAHDTETATQVASATATTCIISFSDVPADSVFYTFIRCLACRGIISGYDDGTFRPGNEITRGQIAKIVSNAANFQDDVTGRQTYSDVPEGETFWLWIERLSIHAVMGGYDCGGPGEACDADNRPYFRPFANATRGQLAKIVSNAAGYSGIPDGQIFADVPTDNVFYIWIERLASRGIMGGYVCGGVGEPCDSEQRPYFRTFNNVTRGQASKIVANTFFPNCQTPVRR